MLIRNPRFERLTRGGTIELNDATLRDKFSYIMMALFIILFFIVLIWGLISINRGSNYVAEGSSVTQYSKLLPEVLIVNGYRVTIYVNYGLNTYSGNIFIDLDLKSAKDSFILYANDLEYFTSSIRAKNGLVAENTTDHTYMSGTLTIKFAKSIPAGKCTLVVRFTDTLMEDIFEPGLFLGSTSKGKFVVTNIDIHNLRNIFPVMATSHLIRYFKLTVAVPPGKTILSTLPEISDTTSVNGERLKNFECQIQMTPFLAGFMIFDDKYLIKETVHEGTILWYSSSLNETRPNFFTNIVNQIDQIMDWFSNYIEITVPFTPLNIIILEGETKIFVNLPSIIVICQSYFPETADETAGYTLAYNIIKQWFGNRLVLLEMSDSWFLDGIVNYLTFTLLESISTRYSSITPSFTKLHELFKIDGLPQAKAIITTDQSTDDQSLIRRELNEYKAASYFRMFNEYLGTENFKAALIKLFSQKDENNQDYGYQYHLYVNKFKTAVDAITNDNYDMTNDFHDKMNHFLTLPGYPVLTVNLIYGGPLAKYYKCKISQERFLDQYRHYSMGIHNKWLIPYTYSPTDGSKYNNSELKEHIDELELSPQASVELWMFFNRQQKGYYRVKYSLGDYGWIHRTILRDNYTSIENKTKAQLIDDAFSLADANLLDYQIPLRIIQHLVNETDYLIWKVTINAISYLESKLAPRTRCIFYSFMAILFDKFYKTYGFNSNMTSHVLEFNLAIEFGCRIGIEDCITQSKTLFNKWVANRAKLASRAIEKTIICTSIFYGNGSEFQQAKDMYQKVTDESEKKIILEAMSCTLKRSLMAAYLKFAFIEDKPTNNYLMYALSAVDSIAALDFTVENIIGKNITYNHTPPMFRLPFNPFMSFEELSVHYQDKRQYDDLDYFQKSTHGINTEYIYNELKIYFNKYYGKNEKQLRILDDIKINMNFINATDWATHIAQDLLKPPERDICNIEDREDP